MLPVGSRYVFFRVRIMDRVVIGVKTTAILLRSLKESQDYFRFIIG